MPEFENPLARIWRDGGTALNGWLSIPSSFTAETMARAGWDTLTLDLQHGLIQSSDLATMLQAIQQTGTAPLARLSWNDPAEIMRALDLGALGVICPMIDGVKDAEAFVSACLYPPKGRRSFGPIRAKPSYGDDYVARANQEILPIVMIETKGAFDAVEEIFSVEGVAGAYIGPNDLAWSLGHPPAMDTYEPAMMQAFEHVLSVGHAKGVKVGMHCGAPAYAKEMATKGFDLVTIGADIRFLDAAARTAIADFRSGG